MSFGKPLQGFLRQWQVNRCLCLVHDDMQAALAVVVCQLSPGYLPDVARAQSAVTSEEESLLYIQVLALRLFQTFHFLNGKELTLAFRRFYLVLWREPVHRVLWKYVLADRHIECVSQASHVVDDRVGLNLCAVRLPVLVPKIVGQSDEIIPVHIPYGNVHAITAEGMDGIGDKLSVLDATFLLAVLVCLHPVGQLHPRFEGGVLQSRLVVCELQYSLQFDGVGSVQRSLVACLGCGIRLWYEVEFQELITALAVVIAVEV